MIVDFHASCGNFPKQGRHWSLDDLTYWADLCGLAALIVESADARIHVREGPHEELLKACGQSGGRFLPAATIKLESDLQSVERARTARQRGFCCVVLHGTLFEDSRVLHEVLAAVCRAPLPVYRELTYGELDVAFRIASAYPQLSFVFAPFSFQALELNHRLVSLPNVYIAMARTLYSVGQLETACRLMGADHILYAGNLPEQHPARPSGVILDAEISQDQRDMVLAGSALKLLHVHGIEIPVDDTHPGWDAPPPYPIIDTHGHIGTDCRRPDFDASPEAVIRFLERAGGEVIYTSDTEGVFGDVLAGNRRTAEHMAKYPERVRGYAVINPWMGDACLEDIRRCHAEGFSGLKPYPYTFGHELSEPVMDPVWDLAAELGLAVLSHSDADDLRKVLEKRPETRILAAHMSSQYREKAELARDYPNVVLEVSGAGAGPNDIVHAIEIAGEENLVFGSDLNTHSLNYTLRPLMCSGLPDATLKAILRDNAIRFFGLS